MSSEAPATTEAAVPPAQEQGHAHSHAPDPARRWISLALVVLALVFVLLHRFAHAPWQDSFTAYFLAFSLEATPFILLGTLVAGMMEQFLPPALLPRLSARLGAWGIPGMALASPLFPTCECGVVSVGRGLLRKGLPLPHTLTYLLAAPILNPMVLIATWLAFRDWHYPLLRGLGGLIVPIAVGLIFSRMRPETAFRPGFLAELGRRQSGESAAPAVRRPLGPKLLHALSHVQQDFIEMSTYFLAGVTVAATLKTFFSASLLTELGAGPVSGPASMMGLAFILSLCSEADAFLAAGFTEFDLTAKLGFMLLGPMLDIKLLLMYRSMLRGRFLALMSAAIVLAISVFLLCVGGLT